MKAILLFLLADAALCLAPFNGHLGLNQATTPDDNGFHNHSFRHVDKLGRSTQLQFHAKPHHSVVHLDEMVPAIDSVSCANTSLTIAFKTDQAPPQWSSETVLVGSHEWGCQAEFKNSTSSAPFIRRVSSLAAIDSKTIKVTTTNGSVEHLFEHADLEFATNQHQAPEETASRRLSKKRVNVCHYTELCKDDGDVSVGNSHNLAEMDWNQRRGHITLLKPWHGHQYEIKCERCHAHASLKSHLKLTIKNHKLTYVGLWVDGQFETNAKVVASVTYRKSYTWNEKTVAVPFTKKIQFRMAGIPVWMDVAIPIVAKAHIDMKAAGSVGATFYASYDGKMGLEYKDGSWKGIDATKKSMQWPHFTHSVKGADVAMDVHLKPEIQLYVFGHVGGFIALDNHVSIDGKHHGSNVCADIKYTPCVCWRKSVTFCRSMIVEAEIIKDWPYNQRLPAHTMWAHAHQLSNQCWDGMRQLAAASPCNLDGMCDLNEVCSCPDCNATLACSGTSTVVLPQKMSCVHGAGVTAANLVTCGHLNGFKVCAPDAASLLQLDAQVAETLKEFRGDGLDCHHKQLELQCELVFVPLMEGGGAQDICYPQCTDAYHACGFTTAESQYVCHHNGGNPHSNVLPPSSGPCQNPLRALPLQNGTCESAVQVETMPTCGAVVKDKLVYLDRGMFSSLEEADQTSKELLDSLELAPGSPCLATAAKLICGQMLPGCKFPAVQPLPICYADCVAQLKGCNRTAANAEDMCNLGAGRFLAPKESNSSWCGYPPAPVSEEAATVLGVPRTVAIAVGSGLCGAVLVGGATGFLMKKKKEEKETTRGPAKRVFCRRETLNPMNAISLSIADRRKSSAFVKGPLPSPTTLTV